MSTNDRIENTDLSGRVASHTRYSPFIRICMLNQIAPDVGGRQKLIGRSREQYSTLGILSIAVQDVNRTHRRLLAPLDAVVSISIDYLINPHFLVTPDKHI